MPRFHVRSAPFWFVLVSIAMLIFCGCGPRVTSVKPSSPVVAAPSQEKTAPEPKEVPKTVTSVQEQAQKAYQDGIQFEANRQYTEAAASYGRAKEIDPGFADAYSHLGLVQIELRNYPGAISTFKRQLEITPQVPDKQATVHSNLGYAYGLNKDLDQAIVEYRKVAELTPNNSEAFATLASTYAEKGLIAEAVNAYQRSLELRPGNKETMRAFGMLCRDNNLFFEAVHIYEQLYSMDNNDPQALRSLAWLYLKIESYPRAIDMYGKLLAIEPESVGERLNLAMAYEKNSQPDSAIAQYEKMIQSQPENTQLYCSLAFLYSNAKKAAQAIEVAKKGLQLKPNDACLNCAWGRALENMSDYEGAIEKFELAVNDSQWGDFAKNQIDKQQKLMKRKEALKEKEELGY